MSRSDKKINIHIYPSPFKHETRMLRVTEALVDRNIVEQVLVVAVAEEGLPPDQVIDDRRRVRRFKLFQYGNHRFLKILRFFEFYVRVLYGLRNEKVGVINCHSLSVLPLCAALKWWHRVPLIYEPHELETETAERNRFSKFVAKWIERRLIQKAARVIVVSHSIADQYRCDYKLTEVSVVLNVPRLEEVSIDGDALLRQTFNIPEHNLVFMYQGLFDEARCVGSLLEVFLRAPTDRHLVLMGFGPMEDRVRAFAAIAPNIHFHPAVSTSDILRYTQGADIGFALLTDNCLNHKFALPNKLFHYLHAGLPVVASDLKEMAAVVDRYGCGWKVRNDVSSLADCISAIRHSDLRRYREAALRAKADFHWEREANKLEGIYGGIG